MSQKNKNQVEESIYKDTLNLPQTEFAMRANLPIREQNFINHWNSIDLYNRQREVFEGRPKFILHDGPPYANGAIHLGHAVNKILKDMIVKSRGQLGYDAPFVQGWDCHGLPIELVVERKFGKVGANLSPAEFRDKCREFAKTQIKLQAEGIERLGILSNKEHPYLTLSQDTEADIVLALRDIVRGGHLLKGARPVNWCIDCGSSLAEAEVEYEDKTSLSIDVAFPVIDSSDFSKRINYDLSGKNISVVIWTTTPWTLPGNSAVSASSDFDYSVVEGNGRYYVVATELIRSLSSRWEIDLTILATFKGEVLEFLELQHAFYERNVPVLLGDHVTLDAGTGFVHTAPAHGEEDYAIGLKYKIEFENPVLANGNYSESTPIFAGQNIRKIEPAIIDLLKEKNVLVCLSKIEHSYPHCWRHKTATIYRATPQWFISMDKLGLRQQILKEINDVQFIPSWGKERLYGMIEGRGDWCISRQRYWGVPIPFFVHKETGELHPETDVLLTQVAERIRKEGLEGWFSAEISEFLSGSDIDSYEKNRDILDVWFDSGTTHYTVLAKRKALAYPADLYLEGSDQHRGWFNSSIITSTAINGIAPYKALLTHGFTVDAQGRKMSKSLGNGIEPMQVIQKMGADVLRLWVSSTDYRAEIPVSDEILTRTSETYRRIRNTMRFLLANTNEFDLDVNGVSFDKMLPLDRWIIDRTQLIQEEIAQAYIDYSFHNVYQKLHYFCSIDLGSFYLDIIKDRQYTCAKDSLARRSCQTALYHILEAMVRWIAPILSFTAEEIWLTMKDRGDKREDSVFLTTFYENLTALDEGRFTRQFWDDLLAVRAEVGKSVETVRNRDKIGSSLETKAEIFCSPELLAEMSLMEDELRFILLTSYAEVKPLEDIPSDAEKIDINGHTFAVVITPLSNEVYAKCVRCWHHREDVGENSEHPELCGRCIENLTIHGETRKYA